MIVEREEERALELREDPGEPFEVRALEEPRPVVALAAVVRRVEVEECVWPIVAREEVAEVETLDRDAGEPRV